MKSLDDRLIIAVNRRGQLNFRVHSDTVQVTTYYQHLQHPRIQGQDGRADSDNDQDADDANGDASFIETIVDIRQFARFLQVYHAQPQDVICSFYENGSSIALMAYLGKYGRGSGDNAGVLSYYLTSLSDY